MNLPTSGAIFSGNLKHYEWLRGGDLKPFTLIF